MRLPRPKNLSGLWWGALFLAIGTWGLVRGHADEEIPFVFLAIGALHVVLSFFVEVRYAEPESMPPGPLRRTPAGRFRATGWPPSKDPDDYR